MLAPHVALAPLRCARQALGATPTVGSSSVGRQPSSLLSLCTIVFGRSCLPLFVVREPHCFQNYQVTPFPVSLSCAERVCSAFQPLLAINTSPLSKRRENIPKLPYWLVIVAIRAYDFLREDKLLWVQRVLIFREKETHVRTFIRLS